MGRSSYGKSENFRPGRGNPLAGRRFEYGQTPSWQGLFGDEISGEYGSRIRNDPTYKNEINSSIDNIKESAREMSRNLRERASFLSGQSRQDYLDQEWIRADSNLSDLRNQWILYRNTPYEPVLNQAIKSEIHVLKTVEDLYHWRE